MDANDYFQTVDDLNLVMKALNVYLKDQKDTAAFAGQDMDDRIEAVRNVDATLSMLKRLASGNFGG